MVRLTGPFSRLSACKIFVAGDLMLDTYTIGKARRISPEAPVAVIHVQREEHRPGGAGNVMLNLVSLGAEVVAMGRLGNDAHGQTLREGLCKENIDTRGLIVQQSYFTTVKNRVIAENQQIVRVDYETIHPLPEQLEQYLIDQLPSLLEGVGIVALSDYGKGFLTKTLISAIIKCARKKSIPVITDPKGTDFVKYSGSTILKPNLGEAYAAANLSSDAPLEKVTERLFAQTDVNYLMITRSESGISIFDRNGERQDFPVRVHEVKDVTGAGDTVLAMLAYALGNQLPLDEAAQLSNVAAGIAIEHLGCARVTLSQMARRLLEYDVVNKVFDVEHLYALQQALKGQKAVLLDVSSQEGFTPLIFNTIRQLSKKPESSLIIHIRDDEPSEDFINLVSSLNEVEFILLAQAEKPDVFSSLELQEIFTIKENTLVSQVLCNPRY